MVGRASIIESYVNIFDSNFLLFFHSLFYEATNPWPNIDIHTSKIIFYLSKIEYFSDE